MSLFKKPRSAFMDHLTHDNYFLTEKCNDLMRLNDVLTANLDYMNQFFLSNYDLSGNYLSNIRIVVYDASNNVLSYIRSDASGNFAPAATLTDLSMIRHRHHYTDTSGHVPVSPLTHVGDMSKCLPFDHYPYGPYPYGPYPYGPYPYGPYPYGPFPYGPYSDGSYPDVLGGDDYYNRGIDASKIPSTPSPHPPIRPPRPPLVPTGPSGPSVPIHPPSVPTGPSVHSVPLHRFAANQSNGPVSRCGVDNCFPYYYPYYDHHHHHHHRYGGDHRYGDNRKLVDHKEPDGHAPTHLYRHSA